MFHEYNQNDDKCIADLFVKVAYVARLMLSQQEFGQLNGLLCPPAFCVKMGSASPQGHFKIVVFVERHVHCLNVSFTPSLLSTLIEAWLSMVLCQSASACPHRCASFIWIGRTVRQMVLRCMLAKLSDPYDPWRGAMLSGQWPSFHGSCDNLIEFDTQWCPCAEAWSSYVLDVLCNWCQSQLSYVS